MKYSECVFGRFLIVIHPEIGVDRRYRPRPQNARDLFKEISEEDEADSSTATVPTATLSSNSMNSLTSGNSDTIDTTALVYLRLRPEKIPCKYYTAESNVLKVHPIENAATNNKDLTEKHFEFSQIFQRDATQLDVYNQSVHAAIQNLESATFLTYGTSGSGKTYTMYGGDDDAGIIQRAIAHIFTMNRGIVCPTPAAKIEKGNFMIISESNIRAELDTTASYVRKDTRDRNQKLMDDICNEHGFEAVTNDWRYVFVWISFAEIYNENVFDLLKSNGTTAAANAKRKNLKIIANDGNAYIKDLTAVHVTSASDAFDVINTGLAQVNYASTNINANSSRSHCILVVNVIHFSFPDHYSLKTYKFCDLAGSERLKKTENIGNRLKEAQRINTSLMVLGRCFDLMFQNQQSKNKEVIPFRESKLTMLLQRSLTGHEKITTIVTMAPKVDFFEENLQVLAFASIAQQIVFKQPKPEPHNRRAARSTRFSFFMAGADRHSQFDDSDYETLLAENAELEAENTRLLDENAQLVEAMRVMGSESAKLEQQLRKTLVEEREQQLNTANEKWRKRVEYTEKRYQSKVQIQI